MNENTKFWIFFLLSMILAYSAGKLLIIAITWYLEVSGWGLAIPK